MGHGEGAFRSDNAAAVVSMLQVLYGLFQQSILALAVGRVGAQSCENVGRVILQVTGTLRRTTAS